MDKARLQVLINPACNHLLRNKAHAKNQTLTDAIETAIKLYYYSSDSHANKCANLFTTEQAAREGAG